MAADNSLSGPEIAARRYARVQLVLAVVFTALMVAVKFALRRLEPDSALRWALVAAPGIVLIAWAWIIVRSIQDADEMMQMLHVRAVAIAASIILTVATIWGLFVSMLNAPDLPAFLLLPAFSLLFSVVYTVLRRRGDR